MEIFRRFPVSYAKIRVKKPKGLKNAAFTIVELEQRNGEKPEMDISHRGR